ncbi:MAG: hypothetical protein KDC49_15140 [Saprospiraceae bacterium]|nr:hypothetical protein [Saprospiraceae bacterium]
MKNRYLVYKVFGLLSAILIMSSYSTGPPEGNTNAPGEGFCGNCHAPTMSSSINGTVLFSYPEIIEKDSTYDISVTLIRSSASVERGGFQLVALKPDESDFSGLGNAGEFMVIPNSNTSANPETGTFDTRQYLGHSPAINFTSDTLVYQTRWKASFVDPAKPTVNFYLAANFANGNGSSSGDRPKALSFTSTVLPLSKPILSCFDHDVRAGLRLQLMGELDEIKSATIENASDALRWIEIGTLPLKSKEQYFSPGRASLYGSYYRVRLESFEGEVLYSDVVECKNSPVSRAYPSPFVDEIFIDDLEKTDQVQLFNAAGQMMDFTRSGSGIAIKGEYRGVVFLQINGEVMRLLKL